MLKQNYGPRIILIISIHIIAYVHGYIQQVTVHLSNNPDDPQVFTFSRQLTKITDYDKLCVRGLWVAFTKPDFQGTSTILEGDDGGKPKCFGGLASKYKSLRYGGNVDTDKASCSIYTETNFRGKETIFASQQAVDRLYGKSFLCTGGGGPSQSSSWAFFEDLHFDDDGKVYCLNFDEVKRSRLGVFGYEDVSKSLKLRHIKSALKNCPRMQPTDDD